MFYLMFALPSWPFAVRWMRSDILNTPLSKSCMTLGGLVLYWLLYLCMCNFLDPMYLEHILVLIGIQDYILNTFDFLEFRILLLLLLLPFSCHGFSKTATSITLKLYVLTEQVQCALQIEILLTFINDLDLYNLLLHFVLFWSISQNSKPLCQNIFRFSDYIAYTPWLKVVFFLSWLYLQVK